jgi:hypothetical protein
LSWSDISMARLDSHVILMSELILRDTMRIMPA